MYDEFKQIYNIMLLVYFERNSTIVHGRTSKYSFTKPISSRNVIMIISQEARLGAISNHMKMAYNIS